MNKSIAPCLVIYSLILCLPLPNLPFVCLLVSLMYISLFYCLINKSYLFNLKTYNKKI